MDCDTMCNKVVDMLSEEHLFFFFNDTATTEIYTLSLHDALPISTCSAGSYTEVACPCSSALRRSSSHSSSVLRSASFPDRKSTRLNSSHANISYAVFCLKKTNKPPALGGAVLVLVQSLKTSRLIS